MSEMQFVRRGINDLMAELAALEDRVAELEARTPAPEIRTRAPLSTTESRCIVPEERVLRWERIEKAAISLADGAWSATAIEAGLKRLLLALER